MAVIDKQVLNTMKKRRVFTILLTALLALTVPASSFAMSLDQAARQAARQHNAKVLSARTVDQNGQRVHVIKVITKDGVVNKVRIYEGLSRKKGGADRHHADSRGRR
jgi:hypothetical protein